MTYIDELEAAFHSHSDIKNYRINLSERRGIGVGIRDNDVGSVYSPFAASETTGGGFLIEWQDGRLSRGNLDGNSLLALDQLLAGVKAAAYDDPDAAQFLGPQSYHDVPRWSPDVPTLFTERTAYLFEVLQELQALAARFKVETLNGGVGAGLGESWLRTSQGLQLHDRTTSCSFSATFDGILGDGDQWRTVVDPAYITTQIERLGHTVEHLRRDLPTPTTSTPTIILHPDVASSLFGYFVWGNMGGSGVYHGQSAFSTADFATQRQVLRSDLTLHVDPWQPLGPDSFAWTGEGLPSVPTTYIEKGRLVQPVLDLKYARRLNLPPTTPPSGARSISLTGPYTTTDETLLPTIRDGLLVLRVLGLHTQDRSSGNYSLATPQALLIRNGEIAGHVRATLSGNFFEHMRADDLQLVTFADQPSPGFAFNGHVAWT
ncbi:MAG: hypothetical protein H0X37_10165 [Herpetosiphonaceae bacterium]|nr:hypothetical protein [Herpetosiphonaceae bacterium]